jgi:hypothetical protein
MISDKNFVVMVASVDNLQDYGQFISDESIGLDTNRDVLHKPLFFRGQCV